MGLTAGGSTILGAIWPELYRTRHLRAIRSLAMSSMVVSAAMGPRIAGWLLYLGVGIETQMIGMVVYTLGISAVFGGLQPRITCEAAAPARV